MLSSIPSSFKPASSAAVNAINTLKMYLFETFRYLPNSVLAMPQNRAIINFVTKMAFAEADGTSSAVETSLLSEIIEKTKDDPDDNLLDGESFANSYFEGIAFYQVCYLFLLNFQDNMNPETDLSFIFFDSKKFFFQHPTAVHVRVVDEAIKLLGKVFAFHKPNSRVQIVEHLVLQLKVL